jgi:hypothetical protein
MTARTEGRNTRRRDAVLVSALVNTGATVYAGCMVTRLTATGNAVSAGTAAAGNCVGVAEKTVVGDGVLHVDLHAGCFQFGNSAAGDAITAADIGNIAYIVDNQTVAKTDNAGARLIAGAIVDVDSNGVWVLIGPGAVGPQGPAGA